MDALKNLATSTVATAPSPATSGTSLVVAAGTGVRYPAAPFDVTLYAPGTRPDPTNAEIARCTAVSTDTLTLTRAQYGTTAQSVAFGWYVDNDVTTNLLSQLVPLSTVTTAGDLIVGSGASAVSRLGVGSNGQVLEVVSGSPTWTTPSAGALTSSANGSTSNVALTANAVNNIYSTASLATGTWLVLMSATIQPTGTTTAATYFQLTAATGTATATFTGNAGAEVGLLSGTPSNVPVNAFISCIATVTVAGTLEISLYAGPAAGVTVDAIAYFYTAIKIA